MNEDMDIGLPPGMMGILSSGIGAPQLGQTGFSSESIDDLINAVARGGGGIFQNILGGLGQIGSAISPALPAIALSLIHI